MTPCMHVCTVHKCWCTIFSPLPIIISLPIHWVWKWARKMWLMLVFASFGVEARQYYVVGEGEFNFKNCNSKTSFCLFHDINLYTALEFTFISKRVFQSEGDFVRKWRKMTFASKTTFKFVARWSVLQKVESFKRRKVKLIVYAAGGELEEGGKFGEG